MKRFHKKTIAFTMFLAMLIVTLMPNISVFATGTGKYALKVLGNSEYSDAVRFGQGYLMLKDGKFNNITPKTQFIYIDENGNKKEIKNTSGFNEIYLNTSGNVYYVDYSTLAVGKDGKVALMDVNGNLYGGSNNYYSCVIHAGDNLFYTTDATANSSDKADTKRWTLRKKDGTVVKEFKNLDIRLGDDKSVGTRIYANGYEYINHMENGEAELISVDKNGKIKLLGKGYDSFTVSSQSKYVVGYKQDYANDKYSITIFDNLGNKLFDLNNCARIEVKDLDRYGYARVDMYGNSVTDYNYAQNIVDLKGNLVLTPGKYRDVKSYDNKMALVLDDKNNVNLVNYNNEVKFDAREFAKKFGATYDVVTFSSYYVDSTMSVTIADTNNAKDPGKTFFFDSSLKQLSGNIEGYVAGYDGAYANLYSRSDEQFSVIKNTGKSTSTKYDEITLESNNKIWIGSSSGTDIYENGYNGEYIAGGFEIDNIERKEYTPNVVARARNWNDGIEYLVLKDGNVINKYSRVAQFISGHAVVEDAKTKGLGVIDIYGNEIVPVGKYQSFVQYINSECFVGYKNGQAFLFDPTGKELTEANKYKEIGRHKANFYSFAAGKNHTEYPNRIFSNNIAITTDLNNKLGLLRVVRNTDFDNNGIVDIKDITMLAINYGRQKGNSGWDERYDLNDDGIIDIYDVVIASKNI